MVNMSDIKPLIENASKCQVAEVKAATQCEASTRPMDKCDPKNLPVERGGEEE